MLLERPVELGRFDGRGPLPGAAADDPVPTEVPALVVRLEPRAAPLREPDRCVSPTAGRTISVHGPAPVCAARVPVSRRPARPHPLAAAREVVPRDPALHRADLP